MEKAFIIFRNFDDYDSQPYAIGFADSKESAIKVCDKLDSHHKLSVEVGEKAIEIVKPFWDEDLGIESGSDWPRWKQGIAQKDITVEMRAERNAIQEENERISERNGVKTTARRESIVKAVSEFIDSLDYDEETMKYIRKMTGDTGGTSYLKPYSYEEVNKLT